jgi:crossover junction endodeoxyribonuclease RuvC
MRTLGIDPGTAIMGWGVVEERGEERVALGYGVLRTEPETPQPTRLLALFEGLQRLIREFQPDEGAVEELFFGKNVNTALTVGQARGVALLALAQAGLPIGEYKPLVVKQAVAGYGGADKRQMQEMVRLTLGLEAIPRPDDAADALAVALCHSFSAPALRRLREDL